MAIFDPLEDTETEDAARVRREQTSDPFFYQGTTPVLGKATRVGLTGEIPGAFPEAMGKGGGPTGPEPGAKLPTPTGMGMPRQTFRFIPPEFPEMPEGPGPPPTRPGIFEGEFGPGTPETPWWQAALAMASGALGKAAQLKKLAQFQATSPGTEWAEPGAFSVNPASAAYYPGQSWYEPGPGVASFTTGFNPAAELAPGAMGPSAIPPLALQGADVTTLENLPWYESSGTTYNVMPDTRLNLAPQSATQWGNIIGGALQGAQVAGGAYNLATGEPGSPSYLASAVQTPAAAAGLASTLGLLGPAWGVAGPAAAALTAPLMMGAIYEKFFKPQHARFPETYKPIAGTGGSSGRGAGAQAVDPTTGAILEWVSPGKYRWAPQTVQRQRATPEQFKQWRIEPTGALLKEPGYASIPQALMQQAVQESRTPFNPSTGQPMTIPEIQRMQQQQAAAESRSEAQGGPSGGVYAMPGPPPSRAQQQMYFGQQRQPTIDRIRAAHPGASEGEIWRLYTLTPEWQQEQAQSAAWNPEGRFGEGR
jgi:hypothetical protein